MKKLITLLLLVPLTFCLFACGGEGSSATQSTDGPVDMDGGVYEGELDSNGERSGQGVWIFDNFRYEGSWAKNLPNGQGTLSRTATTSTPSGPVEMITEGRWVDGYAEGEIRYSFVFADGHSSTWEFSVANGQPGSDMKVEIENGPTLNLNSTSTFAVPPFAPEVETAPGVAAPAAQQTD